MNIEQKRLVDLIEYTKQVTNLKSSSCIISDCSKHGIFCLYEHDVQILPRIKLNQIINDEEVWIEIPRIADTLPPVVEDSLLAIWIKQSKNPDILPTILESVHSDQLDKIISYKPENQNENEVKNSLVFYNDFKKKDYINGVFKIYLSNYWQLWAN
ncbi:MAG: hypothetical protein K2P99_04400, partial [Burkholderiales bacterium]|nr:hypothetical protein [Burkholderiales bacterium]